MTDSVMLDVEPPSTSLPSIDENGKSENILTSQEVSLDAPEEAIKSEPTPVPKPKEEQANLRAQKLPLPSNIRDHKPPPHHVIVLAFGSFAIRYGFASDSTPRRLFPAVAFRRRAASPTNADTDTNTDADADVDADALPLRVPAQSVRTSEERQAAVDSFNEVCDEIVNDLALGDRRRGGGKPIPWKVDIEPVADEHWSDQKWVDEQTVWPFDGQKIIVGKDVQKLMLDDKRAAHYDIVFPMWDGKLNFECGAPPSLIRKALDALIDYIVSDLEKSRKDAKMKGRFGEPKAEASVSKSETKASQLHDEFLERNKDCVTSYVTIVVPETSQRRDAAEIVDAVYRSRSMRCAAVFLQQSAVSCALGAGLATCAVVDIGHSATVVACVEDGIVCGESRIHLEYGSHHIQKAFMHLLEERSTFHQVVVDDFPHLKDSTRAALEDESAWIGAKVCEQSCGFNVDENDTMSVTLVKAPSGRSLRVNLGVGPRVVPAYGLIYPSLLKYTTDMQTMKKHMPTRGAFERNSEDDNFVSDIFNDHRRSGIATSALPIGRFANDSGQSGEQTVNSKKASVVDAIVWSIAKAIEVKRPDQLTRTPDHYRRYLNAIVLAGGGARIDGIAQALEGRIRKGFLDAGLVIADVTVIDGGKGKGDEELAAAAAVLEDVYGEGGSVDDTDTASLPWKGGAVMVEADAVHDYWVYRDDWDIRNVRALRERAPFYW